MFEVVLMKNAVCVLILLLTVGPAHADTLYVRPSADYTNEIKAGRLKGSIQDAIDAASDGDIIVVQEGTYFENINFRGKNIVLTSTDPNNPDIVAATIIDGQQRGSVVTFVTGEEPNCVLNGFMITNGNAEWGGGICCRSNPTIANCIISDNRGEYGGGMYGGSVGGTIITNCTFSRNVASISGGGILLEGDYPTLTKCTFVENSARYGGGLHGSGNPLLTLTNCIFSNNSAVWYGGGIYQNVGYPVLTNCVFYKNSAGHGGGGMYAFDCSTVLTNSIVFGNSPDQLHSLDGDLLVKYSDVQGGWPGECNIDVDPNFTKLSYWDNNGTPDDPEDDFLVDGDYHLKSQAGRWDTNEGRWTIDEVTSPCIDAGDPMSQIMHEPFPNGGIINMGAYGGTVEASKSYFGKPPCQVIVAGDVNGDCAVNFLDFRIMALHWLTNNNL